MGIIKAIFRISFRELRKGRYLEGFLFKWILFYLKSVIPFSLECWIKWKWFFTSNVQKDPSGSWLLLFKKLRRVLQWRDSIRMYTPLIRGRITPPKEILELDSTLQEYLVEHDSMNLPSHLVNGLILLKRATRILRN